jgi:iron complex outermembrane receptor protein
MRDRYRKALLAQAAILTFIGSYQAGAQEAPPSDSNSAITAPPVAPGADQKWAIEEVVVTAQKRQENQQDVPIAITAFSGDQIREMGFSNALEVASQTPNFKIGGLGGSTATVTPWLNIRGIQFTDTSFVNDQSVAMYVDEVYQAATGAGVQQLFDVDHVEVLKGPQGTLFGRNSSAGLVQYVSRQPTNEFEGYLEGSYGQYNQRSIEGAVSGPILDGLTGRFAGKYSGNDGYRHNPQTGIDSFGATSTTAARGTLRYDAINDLVLTVSAHYARGADTFPGRDIRGTRVPGDTATQCSDPSAVFAGQCSTTTGFINSSDDPNITYSVRPSPMDYESYGGYVRGELNLGDVTITSITGYENWRSYLLQDSGAGPNSHNNVTADFLANATNFSEELRASGQYDKTHWVLGAYYYNDAHHVRENLYDWWARISGGTPTAATQAHEGKVDTLSYALFGQIETPITDTVTLAIGGRYSKEDRDMVIARFWSACAFDQCAPALDTSGDASFPNFSGDITVSWKPTDNVMAYAKFARGFKSGGWNPSAISLSAAGPAQPEIVDDWEVGVKSDWWDHRFRADVAAFHYSFDGLQSSLNQIVNGVAVNNFINAGSATIYGTEWELTALPIDALELRAGIGTLFTSIDTVATGGLGILPGNRLPDAPMLNASGLAKYTFDLEDMGSFAVQGDFSYESRTYFTIDNDPYRTMGAYAIYNMRLLWNSVDDRYYAQFAIENLGNKRYATGAFHTPSFDSMYFEPGLPRWWTFKVGVKF